MLVYFVCISNSHARKRLPLNCANFGPKVVTFSARNTNLYKIRKAISCSSVQNFASKLHNVTYFKMLARAVMIDFVLLTQSRILSVM